MSRRAQVDYEDFSRMHSIHAVGRTRRWIPEFAFDEGQLRSVVIHATLGYIYRAGKVPADIETDLAYLKELASNRQAWVEACAQGSLSEHWQACEEYICAVANCGGYMEMIGSVAYRAWRLRWHDADIAATLAMQRESVKRVRILLIKYAERLGFPTFERRKDVTGKEIHDLIARMFSHGATTDLIAAILGRSCVFVRHSLRLQGLYVRRKRPSPLSSLERSRQRVRRCRQRKLLRVVVTGKA